MKGVPYPFNENQVIAPKTELVLVAFDTLPEVNRKYYLDAGVHLNNKRVLDVEFVFNLDVLGVDFGISDEISYGNLRNVIEFTDAKKIFTTLQDDRRKAFFLSLPMPSLYRLGVNRRGLAIQGRFNFNTSYFKFAVAPGTPVPFVVPLVVTYSDGI